MFSLSSSIYFFYSPVISKLLSIVEAFKFLDQGRYFYEQNSKVYPNDSKSSLNVYLLFFNEEALANSNNPAFSFLISI